jgi:Right handed beta helix region
MRRPQTIALMLSAARAFVFTHAHAVQRTHVSVAIGDDFNTASNCTPVAPCRTFQAAMTVTDVNGEVVILDSGGYGAVNINRSVALIAPTGVYAEISVSPDAFGVTVDRPGVKVALRGLTIKGQGGRSDGIVITADKLIVENCVISNLTGFGIDVIGDITVRVTDTIIRDNESGVLLEHGAHAVITRAIISGNEVGVLALGQTPTITTANIANSTIDGNVDGVFALSQQSSALIKISVRNSRIVGNRGGHGLAMQSEAGAAVTLSASNNIISNNRLGISAISAGTKVWASGNTVSDNINIGIQNFGATFESAGNNAVRNNGNDVSGTIKVVGTR